MIAVLDNAKLGSHIPSDDEIQGSSNSDDIPVNIIQDGLHTESVANPTTSQHHRSRRGNR